MTRRIDEATSASIKSEFHAQLQTIRYDLGGSLADLVEDCLANALRKVNDESEATHGSDR